MFGQGHGGRCDIIKVLLSELCVFVVVVVSGNFLDKIVDTLVLECFGKVNFCIIQGDLKVSHLAARTFEKHLRCDQILYKYILLFLTATGKNKATIMALTQM